MASMWHTVEDFLILGRYSKICLDFAVPVDYSLLFGKNFFVRSNFCDFGCFFFFNVFEKSPFEN